MCTVEWVDTPNRASSRIAWFFDSDCLGIHQFSSACGHCGRAGGGLCGIDFDAGDIDGALAVSATIPRCAWERSASAAWSITGCTWLDGVPGLGGGEGEHPSLAFRAVLPMPVEDWLSWFARSGREAISYLPVAIPLALATVVGGIDCTESAAAAGDDYPTGQIIATEGLATIVGALFGGVIQSTPYIGHPAYKAMGARSAYTLATALFVGAAGIFGYFDWIFFVIPKPVIFPILIFVGLEITSQSFHATSPASLSGGRAGVRSRAGVPGGADVESAPARDGKAIRGAQRANPALYPNGHRDRRRRGFHRHQFTVGDGPGPPD